MEPQSAAPALPDQFILWKELRPLVRVTRMSLWRWMRAGTFPAAVTIHGRCYWRMSEVTAWLDKQTRNANPRPGTPRAAAPSGAA